MVLTRLFWAIANRKRLDEASRCLQCKNPTCISGCPVEIDIKKFINQITKKDYRQPHILPSGKKMIFLLSAEGFALQSISAARSCVLTKKDLPFASDEAINIHFLERFVGDYGIKNNLELHCQEKYQSF